MRSWQPVDPALRKAWAGFDLCGALARALGRPTRMVNDADLQGLDASSGSGLEVVVTLGTGFGTAVLRDGVLNAHLEVAQHVFRHDETYDDQLGEAARKNIGNKKWNRRVRLAFASIDKLLLFDHLYVGGGNARHLTGALGDRIILLDPNAGILGGVKLWEQPTDHFAGAAPTRA